MLFKEKRREKRYPSDLVCIENGATCETMHVIDVSVHGLSIICNKHYNCDQMLDLKVELLIVGNINVIAVVRNITWVSGLKRYGLEIIAVPEEWANFVCQLMDEERKLNINGI